MGCRYGIDGRHGSSASFGSKLLEVVSREQFLPTSSFCHPFVAVHLKWPISSSEVAWAPHGQFIKATVDSNKKVTKEPPPHIEFDLRGSTLIVQHFRKYCTPPARDA